MKALLNQMREQRVKLRRAAGRLANRQTSAAFLQWFTFTTEAKHQRVILTRALGKLAMRQQAGAFATPAAS